MKYKYTFKISNSYEDIPTFSVVVIAENIEEARIQAGIIAKDVGLISYETQLILVEEMK